MKNRKLAHAVYAMKLRRTLTQASIEEIQITKEECIKELERRNKKKG